MKTINDDLATINLQYLMLIRELVRVNPNEAVWRFNLDQVQVNQIGEMCLDDIRNLANCGRSLLALIPPTTKPGVDHKLLAMMSDNANRF